MPRLSAYLLGIAALGLLLLFTTEYWGGLYFPFFSLIGGAIEKNLNVLGLFLILGVGFYLIDSRFLRL